MSSCFLLALSSFFNNSKILIFFSLVIFSYFCRQTISHGISSFVNSGSIDITFPIVCVYVFQTSFYKERILEPSLLFGPERTFHATYRHWKEYPKRHSAGSFTILVHMAGFVDKVLFKAKGLYQMIHDTCSLS